MPYLNEWSALEGDYSSSLSGVIKALEDASLRLPINGNVRVRYLSSYIFFLFYFISIFWLTFFLLT